MKKRIAELLKKKGMTAGLAAMVFTAAIAGVDLVHGNQVPELPSYTDPVIETLVVEEETPLASRPKVKINKKGKNTSSPKVTFRKVSATPAGSFANSVKGFIDVSRYASRTDVRVLNAYSTLGFTAEVDPSVSYSGYYDTRDRKITLRKPDDTIYHELGHFAAFISGNMDRTAGFKAIFNQEKERYTGFNKAYVTQSSSEYFAESFKDYTLNPAALKSARPKTYESIKNAEDKFTDDRIEKIRTTYSLIWK